MRFHLRAVAFLLVVAFSLPLQAAEDAASVPKPAAKTDQDLQKSLDNDLIRDNAPAPAGTDVDEEATLEQISARMGEVSQEVDHSQKDPETKVELDKILEDLQKLLKQAEQQQQNQSQKSQQQQSRKQQQKNPTQNNRRQSPQPSKNGQPRPGDQQGKEPGEERDGKSRESVAGIRASNRPHDGRTAEIIDIATLLKDAWGNLPEHEREQMLQSPPEKFLPKYELLIERFYQGLIEAQQKPAR
jgi:hypothetical protein